MTRRNSLNWRTICTDSAVYFLTNNCKLDLSQELSGPGADGNKTFTCDQIQKRFRPDDMFVVWFDVCCYFWAPTDNSHWNDLFYDVKCKIGNLIMYLQNKEMLLINANRPGIVIRIWYRWRDSDRLLYNSYIMLNTKIKRSTINHILYHSWDASYTEIFTGLLLL